MYDGHIIALHEVKKQYQLGTTRVDALKGISFAIGKGEFTLGRVGGAGHKFSRTGSSGRSFK